MIKIAGPWVKEKTKQSRPGVDHHIVGTIVFNTTICDDTAYIGFVIVGDGSAYYLGITYSLEEAVERVDNELMRAGYKVIDDLNQFNKLKNFK